MFARWRFSLLSFALIFSAAPVFSADGTVTVNGEVFLETCTINGGFPNFGVALPTLSMSALAGVGSTAGATRFSIALTHCVGLATMVNTYFEIGPTINAEGRLINQTVGGAPVDGQIKKTDGSIVNLAGSNNSQNTTPISILNQSATQNYTIAYYANAAPVTAGGFSSSVVYTLMYQ
jgi:major type 1 subunit fimbrin (pilin)